MHLLVGFEVKGIVQRFKELGHFYFAVACYGAVGFVFNCVNKEHEVGKSDKKAKSSILLSMLTDCYKDAIQDLQDGVNPESIIADLRACRKIYAQIARDEHISLKVLVSRVISETTH